MHETLQVCSYQNILHRLKHVTARYKGLNTICQMFKTNTLCISFLHKVAKKTFTFKKQGPYNIMTQMQKLKRLLPDISMIHYRVLHFTILKSFLPFQ